MHLWPTTHNRIGPRCFCMYRPARWDWMRNPCMMVSRAWGRTLRIGFMKVDCWRMRKGSIALLRTRTRRCGQKSSATSMSWPRACCLHRNVYVGFVLSVFEWLNLKRMNLYIFDQAFDFGWHMSVTVSTVKVCVLTKGSTYIMFFTCMFVLVCCVVRIEHCVVCFCHKS